MKMKRTLEDKEMLENNERINKNKNKTKVTWIGNK